MIGRIEGGATYSILDLLVQPFPSDGNNNVKRTHDETKKEEYKGSKPAACAIMVMLALQKQDPLSPLPL